MIKNDIFDFLALNTMIYNFYVKNKSESWEVWKAFLGESSRDTNLM